MNKKNVTRYLCLLIALIFVSTSSMLTGCGKKTEEDKTDNSTADTVDKDTGDQASSKEEVIDPLGKYDEPIEITTVLGFGPPEDPKTPKDITPET